MRKCGEAVTEVVLVSMMRVTRLISDDLKTRSGVEESGGKGGRHTQNKLSYTGGQFRKGKGS